MLTLLACVAPVVVSDDTSQDTRPGAKEEEKPPDQEHEALFELAQRATTLVDRLIAAPENEVEAVSQELLKMGPPAIPFLMNKLGELRADRLVKVIDQIHYLEAPPATELEAPAELGLSPTDFEKLKQPVSKDYAKELETLLYRKYLEAIELYKVRRYEQACRLAEAVIAVEPRLSFRTDLQRLKILCEERLLTSRQLAARLATRKRTCKVGETIEVVARIENLTAGPLTIELATTQMVNPARKGQGKSEPGRTHLFVTINYTEYDPYGNVHSIVRQEQVEVDPRIVLGLGQPWKRAFTLETLRDNPLGIVYKEYHLTAEMRPTSIAGITSSVPRKIVFEPLTVRVFPQDIDRILEHPLEFFVGALDAGSPLDILLGAMLVPEQDVPKAIEFIIMALPRVTDMGKRVLMNALRLLTKEPIEFDEQAWIKWWKERDLEAETKCR